MKKMSRGRAKSGGWAAFDLKQRQKQGLEPQTDTDHFPPILTTFPSLHPCENVSRNNDLSGRPFSCVLHPVDFPTSTENRDGKRPLLYGDCSGTSMEDNGSSKKKIMDLYPWADDSLIEDIMAAVGIYQSDKTKHTSFPLESAADIAGLNSTFEKCLEENNIELLNAHDFCGKKLPDDAATMKLTLGSLESVPVEPEWEEDDVYLRHRKDALRMMRSASHHSKAATNAFVRGDHCSAQRHSNKAREEWLAAESLNNKAAKKILNIRNSKNDVWKLDLHGLHASEAIQALREHLQRIETKVLSNHSVSPNKVRMEKRIIRSSSLESFNCMDTEKLDQQKAPSTQRPTSLQVITGIGNHSRGQAALPTAVRSFLNDNGYRFEELRPGVITVRPKFRHRF
ncbi:Small MutS Related domain-containing protein [Prunus dulcis]|uniref:Small MutS Related domain-containing protein n=1 Tax=Prunus dulcis TaxID=3755 RepID=A0A4Y1RN37_PRUDU|nr:Small MutS Related domain-containing protein [Prunus dulcis]